MKGVLGGTPFYTAGSVLGFAFCLVVGDKFQMIVTWKNDAWD